VDHDFFRYLTELKFEAEKMLLLELMEYVHPLWG
jgi:hypothetical protein